MIFLIFRLFLRSQKLDAFVYNCFQANPCTWIHFSQSENKQKEKREEKEKSF